MSGDLISRKKLVDAVEKRYNEKKGVVPDNLAEGFVQMEILIKEQPAAFDLENMISQMEGRLERIEGEEQSADCLMYDGHCTLEQSMRSGMIKAILEDLEMLKLPANDAERTEVTNERDFIPCKED